MADLRLTGPRLAAVRALAENPLTRRALWRVVSADFRVAELAALGPEARDRVEEVPCPRQGAAPRTFGDGDLPVPESPLCTAAGLQAAYRDRTTTPLAVTQRLFQRLDRKAFGPSTYSPFVNVDRAGALEAAEESTARWAAGRPLGPLDGVPVPIKDEFLQKGLPTICGTRWRTDVAEEDAWLVRRLRECGAILPGKVHCTENGLNPLGFNPHHAMPRNVHSSEHGAGGSSTGSAVAVGLGLSPVAISTDGGGSIRIPAAVNGLFGLKPTFNRIGGTGDLWVGTVGHTGPIGGSVTDLVDLMEVCAAPDPDDPHTHYATDWATVIPTWRAAVGRGIRGCRIGVLRSFFQRADPRIAQVCEDALRALEAEGAALVEVDIPLLELANAIGPLVIAGESTANNCDDLAANRTATGDEIRLIAGLMENVTAQQHLRATRVRTQLRITLAAAFQDVDLFALPTTGRLASPYPLSETGKQVADTAWTAAMTEMNFLGNLTGVPAGTAPVGTVSEGGANLPVGLQLMGDAWDEASVIAALAHLERTGIARVPVSPGHTSLLEP
jgi:aspartyl-tRNA(Asn)/glutamyl-tRNA(Gln) amidotransferase subunit A